MKKLFTLFLAASLSGTPALRSQTVGSAIQPKAPDAGQALDALMHDEYTIPLAWNQAALNVNATIKNTSGQIMQISGVQSSTGVWVVDYPKTVPAKGSAVLTAIVEPKYGSQSETEIVRLRTNEGEKTLLLKLDRPPVVALNASRLQWVQGEALTPKTVVVTVNHPSVLIKSVAALASHTAVVQKQGSFTYLITVTPKSTAKVQTFPVTMTLDPQIPGVSPAITCAIVAKK